MERKRKAPEPDGKTSVLPSDIIECILTRLPAKSLLRVKSVCRLWDNIISNPHFINKQFQASSASPRRFLVWQMPDRKSKDSGGFVLLKFEDKIFQTVTEFPPSEYEHCIQLCSCNGIILVHDPSDWCNRYILWNPCSRMRTTISLPRCPTVQAHGICHDPITNDYKVIIVSVDKKKYSVFSCKKKVWTKKNQVYAHSTHISNRGVYARGVVYWLCYSDWTPRQVLFFDGIHEKFGKMQLPCTVYETYICSRIFLINVRGCLGICIYYVNHTLDRMVIRICIIAENSCKWMTVLQQEGLAQNHRCKKHWRNLCFVGPPCPIDDNTMVVFVDCSRYVIFDVGEEMVIGEIRDFSERWFAQIVNQCHDSLFFPIKNSRPFRKCRRT